MENKRTKIVAVIVVVLIIVATICVWLSGPFRSKKALEISLVCTTNDPSLGPIAVLTITNQANASITFLPFLPQAKNHGTWQMFQDWSNRFCDLPPHGTITLSAPISTNCEAWRLPVYWDYIDFTESDSVRTWLIGNIYQNWWLLKRGKGLHYYNRIHIQNTTFSETITNK